MPGFTPAFKGAFRNLTKLANTTPEKLVAKHKQLTPEERRRDMQEKFSLFQRLSESNENIDKMTAFLKALQDTVQSNALAADLKEIDAAQQNKKFEILKKVFQEGHTLNAFAQCWEMYLSQSTPMEEIEKRFKEVSEGSHQAMKALDSQSRFDAVKKTVQEVMRLFYAMFDALLISAGYDVFVPNHGDEQDAGALDPKLPGVFRNQGGMYTPR
ncbi:MAG TPA: hypothetical protein PLL67_02530 [Gammaproteobacteria bacterium]|nr:hypothetical protein [Gammaproteobacteria bacterium]